MITTDTVMAELRTVLDPELGINVVDLGLIYGVYLQDDTVKVDLTLTTPGCPLITEFVGAVHAALKRIPEVTDVIVNLTFNPPWDPSKMSDDARDELGFV